MPKGLKYALIGIASLLILCVLVLTLMDWNALRGPVARFATQVSGRPVSIDGRLSVRIFSLTPKISVEGLTVGNPPWAVSKDENMAEIGRLQAELKLLPLFTGKVIVPSLEVDKPVLRLHVDGSGRGNWESETATPQERSQPAHLPAVRRFVLNDGQLQFVDEVRKLKLMATVVASEESGNNDANSRPFHLDGEGDANGDKFKLTARGGPLINIDPSTPYSFDSEAVAGKTRIKISGTIAKPFDLGSFEATLDASGPDLADLYNLTQLALPNTPPYKVSGRLHRRGTRFDLDELQGVVGGSDMHGALTIETGSGRPKLSGEIASRRLDFKDLAVPLGAPPDSAKTAEASPKQKKLAAQVEQSPLLLPDAKLDITRVRAMDAEVRLRADAVNAPKLPLRKVVMNVGLQNGVLTLKPVSFEFPQGAVSADVQVDASQDVPRTDVDLRLSKLRLEDFFKQGDAPPALAGTLQGRAQLKGQGNSVHEVASSVNGHITLVVPEGEIRAAFAELTGIDLAKGIGLLLTKDHDKTGVRCGVADFKAQNGMLTADTIVVDTDDVLITGGGAMNLGAESLNLQIKGQPKKLRFIRLRTPIELKGTLRKPAVGIQGGKLVAQTGAAAAVGTLLAPVAALLAFVDPGLAKDANCGALLEQAKSEGASVKPATPK